MADFWVIRLSNSLLLDSHLLIFLLAEIVDPAFVLRR